MAFKLLLSRSISRSSILGIWLLLVAALPLTVVAQGKLKSRAKRDIKKALTQYSRASTDEARSSALPGILLHGRPAIDHLLTYASHKKLSDAAAAVRFAAPKLLGWDLLSAKLSPALSYVPSYFLLGEVVLVRRAGKFGGFRVKAQPDPDDGVAEIEWWSQPDLKRKLDQAGKTTGTQTVSGTSSATPLRANTGYNEQDFSFQLDGIDVKFRWVGPNCFRPEFNGLTAWALTGQESSKGLRGNDPRIGFFSEESEMFRRLRATLTDYTFRILPGCTPLPLTKEEEAGFAQYQQVIVSIRTDKPSANPIVLVRLTEHETSGFEAYHEDYIRNYCREIMGDVPVRVLVAGGAGDALEGGLFWSRTSWKRPDKKLMAFLRMNFPEG